MINNKPANTVGFLLPGAFIMNKKEIIEYQNRLVPWAHKCDVTMVDVVVCGLVGDFVYIVDEAILKMIE